MTDDPTRRLANLQGLAVEALYVVRKRQRDLHEARNALRDAQEQCGLAHATLDQYERFLTREGIAAERELSD